MTQTIPTEDTTPADELSFDVLIIGAGPAGLACAIRLRQLAIQHNLTLSVCVLEKASEVGRHTLSGAVIEIQSLLQLFPDLLNDCPLFDCPVTHERFFWLSKKHAVPLPIPKYMQNKDNYIVRLGHLCSWLADKALQLDVEIFPGFTATQPLFDNNGNVCGCACGEFGRLKDNSTSPSFQPSISIHAKHTIVAEGCRGSVAEQIINKFSLRKNSSPPTYALALKELWQISPNLHQQGTVWHSIGWPLSNSTYGGSFLYLLPNNILAIGFAVALDYDNPSLSPYLEFQRFKHHPKISQFLLNGKRISYGARCISEGGHNSLPQCHFPGGFLIGCSAGLVNIAKIKGVHNAVRSALLVSQFIIDKQVQPTSQPTSQPPAQNNVQQVPPQKMDPQKADFQQTWKHSSLHKELYKVRHVRDYFRLPLPFPLLLTALDLLLLKGRLRLFPKLKTHDRQSLLTSRQSKPIQYPKPDNIISFPLLTNLAFSSTYHNEDQPIHLKINNPHIVVTDNMQLYDNPETKYCPAGVYEIVYDQQRQPCLQINAANCLHCKACDIKDPFDNIRWTPPQGGEGPNYDGL